MAVFWGYFYDKDGRFTEMRSLPTKPIMHKYFVDTEVIEEVITNEKLCEVHQEDETGKYECPNCVMFRVDYVPTIKPVEHEEYIGEEPIVPANCTMEQVPDGIYEPVFKDGKWVKTKDYTPPTDPVEPSKPPEKSEVEELREQLNKVKKVLDELLIGGVM
ncbi:hypothetical protein [Bacillus phage Carmen17]|uniref:Uncharacterized protein n=1 Tax=Bacillus phage Carmen17 TaxID=2072797 RepID=A0A2I7QIN3_9CAUD|nr:hypothetical protein HWB53_gp33 [Bacillus phage Carmen17]AUR81257.1 hypothetical protein [Bacillus phage Carmen17]